MICCHEKPTSGQFTAMWYCDSGLFAQTFKYREDGYLLAYDSMNDEWECEHGYDYTFFKSVTDSINYYK